MDYESAEIQIKELIKNSDSEILLTEVVNFLFYYFNHYSWIGIYIVKGNNLILGPWKGPHATEHIKIPIGQGICGAAAASGKTELIDDIKKDTRYLSCFVSTKSEIVVPIKKNGKIIGEIDIDSDKKGAFSTKIK